MSSFWYVFVLFSLSSALSVAVYCSTALVSNRKESGGAYILTAYVISFILSLPAFLILRCVTGSKRALGSKAFDIIDEDTEKRKRQVLEIGTSHELTDEEKKKQLCKIKANAIFSGDGVPSHEAVQYDREVGIWN